MHVLEEVGFEVQVPEALNLFAEAGAVVDRENRKVRIKESLVKEQIKMETITYARGVFNQAFTRVMGRSAWDE